MRVLSQTPNGDYAYIGPPPSPSDPQKDRGRFYLPDVRVLPRMKHRDNREAGCEIHPMRGSAVTLAVFVWSRGRLVCKGWVHVDDLRPYGRVCHTAQDWAHAVGYDLTASRDDVIENMNLPSDPEVDANVDGGH